MDTVQSLSRGLGILALIGDAPGGLPLHAIADRSGLKKPTAHKILGTLVREGFAERLDKPPRYRLGPALFDLVRRQRELALAEQARDALLALAGECPSATLTCSRFLGGEIATLLRISPERPGFVQRPDGLHLPPYTSATGLLFQAYWSEDERNAFLDRYPFAEYGRHVWPDAGSLEAFLKEVRRTGRSAPRLREGFCCVAAPVLDGGGAIRAALGASHRSLGARLDRRTVAAVTEAAQTLSTGAP